MIEAIEMLKNSGNVIVDEDHVWGYQLRLSNEPQYCGKILVLENTRAGSHHFHHRKKETFVVLQGSVDVYVGDDLEAQHTLSPGDQLILLPHVAHKMMARHKNCIVLEISTHDDDNDTYRMKEP